MVNRSEIQRRESERSLAAFSHQIMPGVAAPAGHRRGTLFRPDDRAEARDRILAIQQWTILKLVGPAATDAVSRFDRWWKARRSDDLSCFSPEDWRPTVRRAATAYFTRLTEHRLEMPVAYFSQHVDLWLAAGQMEFCLDTKSRVWHDAGQLWCYCLPDRGKLLRRNHLTARSTQFPENAWLTQRLVEATRAYDKLWPRATILINRQAVTASPTDAELKSAAAVFPKWLGRSTVR